MSGFVVDGHILELYPEPTVRELMSRADADETFARVLREVGDDLFVATLTSLAVLRGREAAERLQQLLDDTEGRS